MIITNLLLAARCDLATIQTPANLRSYVTSHRGALEECLPPKDRVPYPKARGAFKCVALFCWGGLEASSRLVCVQHPPHLLRRFSQQTCRKLWEWAAGERIWEDEGNYWACRPSSRQYRALVGEEGAGGARGGRSGGGGGRDGASSFSLSAGLEDEDDEDGELDDGDEGSATETEESELEIDDAEMEELEEETEAGADGRGRSSKPEAKEEEEKAAAAAMAMAATTKGAGGAPPMHVLLLAGPPNGDDGPERERAAL